MHLTPILIKLIVAGLAAIGLHNIHPKHCDQHLKCAVQADIANAFFAAPMHCTVHAGFRKHDMYLKYAIVHAYDCTATTKEAIIGHEDHARRRTS